MISRLQLLVLNYLEPLMLYHTVMVINVFIRIIGCQMLCVWVQRLNYKIVTTALGEMHVLLILV